MVTADDLDAARSLVLDLLRPLEPSQWDAPVPDLGFTVSDLVTHLAQVCLWYSLDLAALGAELDETLEPTVKVGPPDALLATLETTSDVLGRLVLTADPTDRMFHPFGLSDPEGAAAMGCDELLVHGRDLALAVGQELDPPDELAARVLARLFPWVPAGDGPWSALLWANGRIAWDGRERMEGGWRWHAAPLDEWDGTEPPS